MVIGGNIEALLQEKIKSATNAIGEKETTWGDIQRLRGWLDLSTGDSRYTYAAKLQESTHIFICDYTSVDRHADNKRMVVNGCIYDVLLIDDPMELHQQLEIYLKYVGR